MFPHIHVYISYLLCSDRTQSTKHLSLVKLWRLWQKLETAALEQTHTTLNINFKKFYLLSLIRWLSWFWHQKTGPLICIKWIRHLSMCVLIALFIIPKWNNFTSTITPDVFYKKILHAAPILIHSNSEHRENYYRCYCYYYSSYICYFPYCYCYNYCCSYYLYKNIYQKEYLRTHDKLQILPAQSETNKTSLTYWYHHRYQQQRPHNLNKRLITKMHEQCDIKKKI